MPDIVQGQEFPTLKDFKKALTDWAIEKNFTPAILDSDNLRVRAGCRSAPDCTFKIRCTYSEKKGRAKVSTCDDVHTCALVPLVNQEIKRPAASKLKFLLEAVPKHLRVDANTPTKAIVDVVKQHYGQDIALRQAQKVKAHLCPRPPVTCRTCGAASHGNVRCPQRPPINAPRRVSQPTTVEDDAPMVLDFDDDRFRFRDIGELEMNDNDPPRRDVDTIASVAENQVLRSSTPRPNYSPRPSFSNTAMAHLSSAIDPSLMAESLPPYMLPLVRHVHESNPLLSPPVNSTEQFTGPPARQPMPRTAQDTRMEAARLMQQAGRLMEEAARINAEAARLNAEAARLTASVANV